MIRSYTRYDYPMMKSWYKGWGKVCPNEAVLPTRGYICDETICGFLYQTDSNVALIEAVIGDPTAPAWKRRSCLMKLGEHLTEKALELGFEHIIAVSAHPSIGSICSELGYKESPTKLWVLNKPNVQLTDEDISRICGIVNE